MTNRPSISLHPLPPTPLLLTTPFFPLFLSRVIDGLIVVEEFGKELAAIALVKYHLAAGE